jgi:Domain of unknown function (DUF4258)
MSTRVVSIIWDLDDDPQGNVQHILEHGLAKDEVEDVLRNPQNSTTESKSSGNPVTFGWTSTGRYIVVVWEHITDDPLTVYPITAYEVEPSKE